MPFINKLLVLTVSFLAVAATASARKIYIKKLADNGVYMHGRDVLAGDTLVTRASLNNITYFAFEHLRGTSSQPIVIINEGGQVYIDRIKMTGCTYVKLTGSGSSDQYGFRVESGIQDGVGIEIHERSAHVEVERVFINNKKYGFWVKQEAGCADSLNYPNWTLSNISIHDTKITNMEQEAMYLGSSAPNGERGVVCNGVTVYPKPMRLSNIKVYNNIIDRTNRGGIQLSGADNGDNEIYNNTVTNIGYEFNTAQGNAIVLGGYTQAYVHDNVVNNTFSSGIFALGAGLIRIENNRIDNSGTLEGRTAGGMSSIMLDTRLTNPVKNTSFIIKNNTVGANTDNTNIRIYNSFLTFEQGNQICYNKTATGADATVKVASGINWTNCLSGNQIPVAKAGPDQTITYPVNTVQMTGSGSDADGLITTYAWTKVSGPTNFTFSNSAIPSPMVSNLEVGTYIFRLTVWDNSGATGIDDVSIIVNPAPPASAYTTIPAKVEAEAWGLMSGVQTETTTDAGGGLSVGYIDYGDWMDYNISAPAAGTYKLDLRLATPNSTAKFQILKPDGTVLTTVTPTSTGGYQSWQTFATSLPLAAGNQIIRIYSIGAAFNINWLQFPDGTATSTQTSTSTIKVEAENFATMAGVQLENTSDAGGGLNVGYIDNGDWMDYSVTTLAASAFTVNLRVAALNSGGQLQLKNAAGTVLATVNVPQTSGYQNWQTVTATINLPLGTQTIRISSSASTGWNINWIEFVPTTSTTTTTTSTSTITRIEAEKFTSMSGIQTETTSDAGNGLNVGYIDNGDWMEYSVTTATSGSYNLAFRVAAQNSGAQLQIRNSGGTVLASVAVPQTGGYQTWQTVNQLVTLPAGTQTIRIVSAASTNWNMNWMELSPSTSTTTTVVPTKLEAENYSGMSGVQTEATGDAGGGLNVGYIDNNDWMDYAVSASVAGTYKLDFRVAAQSTGGQFQVRKSDGTVLATVTVPATGGYQTWQTISTNVALAAGSQTIRLVSTNWVSWNINWLEFTSGTTSGTITSSKIAEAEIVEIVDAFEVFPNPVKDRFAFQVNNDLTGSMKVQITDKDGVVKKQYNLTKATTGSLQTYLSASGLASGEYTITVEMQGWKDSKLFVKQ